VLVADYLECPRVRHSEGLGRSRRARLRGRRDFRRQVREPAQVPPADERTEAAAALPSPRYERGEPPRARGHRDGVRLEAAGTGRRARVLLPRGPRANARLPHPTRSCSRSRPSPTRSTARRRNSPRTMRGSERARGLHSEQMTLGEGTARPGLQVKLEGLSAIWLRELYGQNQRPRTMRCSET